MTPDEHLKIARTFIAARNSASGLDAYPGEIPATLDEAYLIQDQAIDAWQDEVEGWKVGRIPIHLEEGFGIDRLAGPMFSRTIHHVSQDPFEMPVFAEGFAAIEAEYLAVIEKDAPADQREWSLEESLAMIGDLRIGIEIASSPLSTINELGPSVVVSDFGNNAGLMIGPSIANWSTRDLESFENESLIDGESVGKGGAYQLTGGFLRSVQFMLELAAKRGRPLKKGCIIATGQTNGIHEVRPGQSACANFGDDGEINCVVIAAVADNQGGEGL